MYLENRIYEYPEITTNVRDRKKTSEELSKEGNESKKCSTFKTAIEAGCGYGRTGHTQTHAYVRSNKKGRRVDALALRAEERRDKLRKAPGRRK